MFKISLAILSFASVALLFWTICPSTEEDTKEYQGLLESSDPTRKAEIVTYSQQKREKVNKEIWWRASDPLNIHIECSESELFFFQQENQIEVVEELTEVHAVVQEELYFKLKDGREALKHESGKYLIKGADPKKQESWVLGEDLTPMQQVRAFTAEKGCYNYKTQLFLGQNVLLKTYKIKGHSHDYQLEKETPLLAGQAKSIEFQLKGKKLDIQARSFQAKFDSFKEKK